jgi:hypothetical protein
LEIATRSRPSRRRRRAAEKMKLRSRQSEPEGTETRLSPDTRSHLRSVRTPLQGSSVRCTVPKLPFWDASPCPQLMAPPPPPPTPPPSACVPLARALYWYHTSSRSASSRTYIALLTLRKPQIDREIARGFIWFPPPPRPARCPILPSRASRSSQIPHDALYFHRFIPRRCLPEEVMQTRACGLMI